MKTLNRFLQASLLLIFCSCNSWLNVDLKNEMEEHKLFSSEQGFREALAGVYGKMSQKEMYGQDLTFGIMDLLGQTYDAYHMDKQMLPYTTYSYTSSDVQLKIDGFWKLEYSAIASLNNILRFVESNGGVMKPAVRDQIKGEALALRAFLHFDLYRMFAPDVKLQPHVKRLPYVRTFGVEKTPFSTGKEFLSLVVQDLKEAEGLLVNDPIHSVIPYQLGTDESPEAQTKTEADTYVARMNYWAVEAILARVYLAMGNLTDARAKALEVIAAKQFRLMDAKVSLDVDKEAYWDILFSDEHIFSLRDQKIRENAKSALNSQAASGTNFQLTELFIPILYPNSDDWRRMRWFNSALIMKYTRENDGRFKPKVALIRLVEMYFIVAETYLEEDNPEEALKYINQIRDSRLKNNRPLEVPYTKEDLILEMRREFIAEGQYFFMYKRMNHVIPTLSVNEINPSDEVFVFPLPEAEVINGNR